MRFRQKALISERSGSDPVLSPWSSFARGCVVHHKGFPPLLCLLIDLRTWGLDVRSRPRRWGRWNINASQDYDSGFSCVAMKQTRYRGDVQGMLPVYRRISNSMESGDLHLGVKRNVLKSSESDLARYLSSWRLNDFSRAASIRVWFMTPLSVVRESQLSYCSQHVCNLSGYGALSTYHQGSMLH